MVNGFATDADRLDGRRAGVAFRPIGDPVGQPRIRLARRAVGDRRAAAPRSPVEESVLLAS